jgi:hypothetical protein
MSVEITPLINGKNYGWADIRCFINGMPITAITAIKYEDDQEKENVYGAGALPVSRASGRIKPTASITLMMEQVVALQSNAPNGRLTSIAPFPIVVMYQPEAGPVVKDVIMNAEFKKNTRDWKEGDMKKEVPLDLLISHIVWHKK